MKKILSLIVLIFLTGCTITFKPYFPELIHTETKRVVLYDEYDFACYEFKFIQEQYDDDTNTLWVKVGSFDDVFDDYVEFEIRGFSKRSNRMLYSFSSRRYLPGGHETRRIFLSNTLVDLDDQDIEIEILD